SQNWNYNHRLQFKIANNNKNGIPCNFNIVPYFINFAKNNVIKLDHRKYLYDPRQYKKTQDFDQNDELPPYEEAFSPPL
ncbi:hypothetical protein AAHH80_37855, partial [Burkholderia pseudomallei]